MIENFHLSADATCYGIPDGPQKNVTHWAFRSG